MEWRDTSIPVAIWRNAVPAAWRTAGALTRDHTTCGSAPRVRPVAKAPLQRAGQSGHVLLFEGVIVLSLDPGWVWGE